MIWKHRSEYDDPDKDARPSPACLLIIYHYLKNKNSS